MKLSAHTTFPKDSGQLDVVITKQNGWYVYEDFQLLLQRERERELRTGWDTAFVHILLPNHNKLPKKVANRSYDRFLAQFIGIISNYTRSADIKSISPDYCLSILLVDSSMDKAKIFIQNMANRLADYFQSQGLEEEIQILREVVIASYALTSIDNSGETKGDPVVLHHFKFLKRSPHHQVGGSNGNGKSDNEDDSYYFNWSIFSTASQPAKISAPLKTVVSKSYHPAYPFIKRCIDIVGSTIGILAFFPLMLLIAVLVKFTSKGPVLFKQKRIGYRGEIFTFLKFRSMRTDMDDSIHREYVAKLIEGKNDQINNGSGEQPVYKITQDPRITKIGSFLRRTSLDEIPQFFNVLSGKMSLVGPRPPIPYEVDMYEEWHLRRVMEAKPGITGLWQVYGRNQTTFDEMVRLDLQYINKRSILLDLKLILQTITVLFNPGAGL
ncbi:MAG: sugar transferase [Calditrichota bacterium]